MSPQLLIDVAFVVTDPPDRSRPTLFRGRTGTALSGQAADARRGKAVLSPGADDEPPFILFVRRVNGALAKDAVYAR
jgi:hypothetical protein